jgi:predicted dehydrogenase
MNGPLLGPSTRPPDVCPLDAAGRWLSELITSYSRDTSDVAHKIVAIGSRSTESAKAFVDKMSLGSDVKAYKSYDDVFADPVSLPSCSAGETAFHAQWLRTSMLFTLVSQQNT